MKKLMQNLFLLSSILFFMLPESASALPSFTRQTGKSCTVCHIQNTPKLNGYGRNFSLSGYANYNSNSETQSLIEGAEVTLGMPSVLNVSAVLKARYVKTTNSLDINGSYDLGTERGELQVLEGSGLYFAGRIADNIGGIISIIGDPSTENDVALGGKAILSYPTFNGFGGISLYSTQINGTFSGMENFNTGLNAPLKQFENAYVTNAAQATGIANGPATGLQLYYGDNNLFATLGVTIPSQNNEGIDAGGALIPFGRVSYNMSVSDWNFMLGAYGLAGDVKASDQSLDGGLIDGAAKLINIYKEGYGFDFEATGSILDMQTMTTINVVLKNIIDVTPISSLTSTNLQQTNNRATSVEFQINPILPLGVKVAYLNYNNKDETAVTREFVKAYDFNAYSFGLNYLVRQNITLDAEYSYIEPDEQTLIENYYDFYLVATLAF
ncbi:hypothetical protein HUE87_03485 [Candidatus Sulfurimonas marisnigri]|uniref:Cytochrome c domain-containing protein n=1 Tax=Candidatus Sulfurimonas marisnigri TaxID=2740405 RepID=A0A7S7M1J7_9BACT|nr:hypothetical protein [Candidatus Sulfurimonas marisnigri]QOY55313.1 hypothetical protein HUE87_03485 [Candidatus Sulfurimonas marisnigri]